MIVKTAKKTKQHEEKPIRKRAKNWYAPIDPVGFDDIVAGKKTVVCTEDACKINDLVNYMDRQGEAERVAKCRVRDIIKGKNNCQVLVIAFEKQTTKG